MDDTLRPCGRIGDRFRETSGKKWRRITRRAYRGYGREVFGVSSQPIVSPEGPGTHRPIPAQNRLTDATASLSPILLDLEQ